MLETLFIKVERIKKANDVQTYKEIIAFMNGETLDNISKAKEIGKRNYQKLILGVGAAILTIITTSLIRLLLNYI